VRLSKKIAIAAVSTVAAVGVATSAFAYWSTTGSGSGSGTAAAGNGALVLHGTIVGSPYPGGSNEVTLTADNASATDLIATTVKLDSVSVDAGHSACRVADFSMADVASGTVVLHGTTGTSVGTGSLVFANDPANSQDACKGASITLHLSSI
jgi:hypothetical protein